MASNIDSEFSGAITDAQLVSWPRVAAVSMMVGFSLPTFVTGLEIYLSVSLVNFLIALVVGCGILAIVGGLMGVIGAKTRLSSYLLVRIAFGDRGAGVVNIAFAISLLGWYGFNIDLFSGAVSELLEQVFNLHVADLPIEIFASICMTLTTIFGFRAINILSSVLIPIMLIATFWLAYSSLSNYSLGDLIVMQVEPSMSLGAAISSIVGAIIIGAIILPDITRFIRGWKGALTTAFLSYVVVQLIVMIVAAMAAAASGKTEILEIMLSLGMGFSAFAIVIAGSWILNSLNLYSSVLSVEATFPKLKSNWLIIALGVLGVVAASLNILDMFLTFLFYLAVVFIPVAGVILVDYFLIRPSAYCEKTLESNRLFSPIAFFAWFVGALVAALGSNALLPTVTGIAALDAIAISAIGYGGFSWKSRERKSK